MSVSSKGPVKQFEPANCELEFGFGAYFFAATNYKYLIQRSALSYQTGGCGRIGTACLRDNSAKP
jgi:hypothetical protein